ncbi:hypothetical protein FACS1894105_03650 [Clostridia bacterium]|nr:hypothetical protein FACS1894105_03650 [Clostridia bacterium]
MSRLNIMKTVSDTYVSLNSNKAIAFDPDADKDEWEAYRKEHNTPEQIAQSDIRVALMCALIDARDAGIGKSRLAELSGLKESFIERVILGDANPTLDKIIKLLLPLGKTLYIGDIKSD